MGRLLCGPAHWKEEVATRVPFAAGPEEAWQTLLTYEEVAHSPPWYLQFLFPRPLRTRGDKTRPGADVLCEYDGGGLVKRIHVVDPPRLLEFSVLDQRLGIEDCLVALGGSYRLRRIADGSTEVELTTRYVARLRPRWLWRPVEAWIAHRFHRHILEAMRAEITQGASACRT